MSASWCAMLDRATALDLAACGRRAIDLVEALQPLPRSITGDGVRASLSMVRETLDLGGHDGWTVHEVPSGETVLDWTVPDEWNVRSAWIRSPAGDKVVDFADNTLHLLSYSVAVHRKMPLSELQDHLHSLPEQPDLIPYRTSYYTPRWGFCLPHRQREQLVDGEYEVFIDSSLAEGSLSYGEFYFPGVDRREVLLSTHICHPSMCNDNLSGMAVLTEVARELASLPLEQRRFSYRLLFVPGTIGAVCWLARNRDCRTRVVHGLVAANLGDPGAFHYKKSRSGAPIDRAVAMALAALGETVEMEDFSPFGYDERQYCSPGFDLPMGSLTRSPWGRYPEYHTSADDLALVQSESLARSVRAYLMVLAALECDLTYTNLAPFGEPQLGKRGLYGSLGGGTSGRDRELALLWLLNQSDGQHSLLDIAQRSGLAFDRLVLAADQLEQAGLLRRLETHPGQFA